MALESAIGSANTTRASSSLTLRMKFSRINWPLVVMLAVIASVGAAVLYSAGRGWMPWAGMHLLRFSLGVMMMLTVAMIDIRHWMRLAYPIYGFGLVLLIWVEIAGEIGMGAQRWIDLGFLQLQPSEIMKIALVMVFARHYHSMNPGRISRPVSLLLPLILVLIPVALVMRQPDLGTALLLLAGAGGLMFLAGVSWIYFAGAIASVMAALPIAWGFLREYQKNRVLTFLNPEQDPLGTGYHIMQSKIAFGSGGIFGKGYMQGTQSHLDFLPEMQTDFIFTMFAEEMGMIGAILLLCLFGMVIVYGYVISLRVRHQFGRLIVLGVILNFFLYVFINMAMVMGLIPVVGVPLPFVSYGGTAMLTLLFGFGLVLSASVHRGVPIPENAGIFF
ncbi:MAG: rod shape-determining protein RodA [Alphaproteobacteria bacterium]